MSPEGSGCRVLVSEANVEGVDCERFMSHCKCTLKGNWRSRPLLLLFAPNGHLPKPYPPSHRELESHRLKGNGTKISRTLPTYVNLSYLQVIFAPDIFPLMKQKHH